MLIGPPIPARRKFRYSIKFGSFPGETGTFWEYPFAAALAPTLQEVVMSIIEESARRETVAGEIDRFDMVSRNGQLKISALRIS